MIDGVWRRSTTVLNDGNGNPPSGWDNPYRSGVLDFLDGSTAVFRASDANLSVTLQRTRSTDRCFASNLRRAPNCRSAIVAARDRASTCSCPHLSTPEMNLV